MNNSNNTTNNYYGEDYSGDGDDHHHDDDDFWDNGGAALTGLAVGTMAGAAIASANETDTVVYAPQPIPVLPCAAQVINVNGVPYYSCGNSYYTAGYADGGVMYTPAAPPPQS